jgi:hypothetical protein
MPIKVHNVALKYGKYYGNAGSQYLSGYPVTAGERTWFRTDQRVIAGRHPEAVEVQRGNAPEPDDEPLIGLAGGQQPGAAPTPRGRGGQ